MAQKVSLAVVSDAGRTAIATAVSYLVARAAGMPEAYWAPIITAVVIQSKLGAALQISLDRLIGTVLGAALGGLLASLFTPSWWLFGIGVFMLGLICGVANVPNSFRFSAMTLAIIELVPRGYAPWKIAIHRSVEVTIGIAVGVVITAIWQDRPGPVTEKSPAS